MKPGSLKITKVLTNAVGEAAEKMFKFEVIIKDSRENLGAENMNV